MSSQSISQLVMLSEVSYTDFSLGLSEEQVRKALIGEKKDNLPESYADIFLANWSIERHWKDQSDSLFDKESGFSCTLFKGKTGENAGKYVLPFKGTAGGKDLLIADAADIVHDGLANYKIIDMYFRHQVSENGKLNSL